MKWWKIFLLIGIFLSMCASAALAVEVQVVVIGHGYVSGKDVSCMTTCSQSYEKGAVVQFKAIPFPDSQFAGWTVNGESHQEVITIEKDTVVTAAFERSSADPNLSDGMTVYWYNGNGGREYATIVLDEIVIQLDDTKYWDSLSDDAYQNAVQSFISRFHEQAIAKRGYPGLLLLQSPQPLDKERWLMSVAELQQIDGIRWAGPMLYRASEYTWGKRMVGNEIYVDFPQAYSEEQIKRIEQEYHLKRVHVSTTIPNSFTYQAKNPLEAIGLANHLYESGLVEYSGPAIPDNVTPTSEPANGVPHEGAITIERNTVVTAIYEPLAGLDELTVYWYNGNVKIQASIAPDEMVVFLTTNVLVYSKEKKQWMATPEPDVQAALQKMIHQFHPQSEMTPIEMNAILLKSPKPLSKDQWFNAFETLKGVKYVKYTGPMLYADLEKRWDYILPIGEIIVRLPANYTESQIQAIEQEYHLIRKRILPLGSETSYYYFTGEPLESIAIANQLYESGKVESASPNMAVSYSPL